MTAFSVLCQLQDFLSDSKLVSSNTADIRRCLDGAKLVESQLKSSGAIQMDYRVLMYHLSESSSDAIPRPFKPVWYKDSKKKPISAVPSSSKSSSSKPSHSFFSCLADEGPTETTSAGQRLALTASMPAESTTITTAAAVWQQLLIPTLPWNASLQAMPSSTGDESYGQLSRQPLLEEPCRPVLTDGDRELNAAAGGFGRLPLSLLLCIVQFNRPAEIAALSCSSRQLQRLCSDDWLWRGLLAKHFPDCRVLPDPSSHSSHSGIGGRWRAVWLLEANQVRYQEVRCFVNKTSFQQEVLGIPLDWSVNPKTRKIEYIYSNMELMGQTAWQHQAVRKTSWGEDVKGWLPVYLSESHFRRALQPLEASLALMAPQLLGEPNAAPVFKPLLVLEVLPRLMKTLAVLLVDHGLQGPAAEQALQGYCMLHRLFIALVMHYSELRSEIQRRLQQFVHCPRSRSKTACPDLGLLVPLVAVSEQLGWVELVQALLGESFARQVLWACRDVPQLAQLPRLLSGSRRGGEEEEVTGEQRALLQRLFDCSAVRRRLLSFQCCFLRVLSGPHGCSLALTAARYDRTLSLPPLHTLRRLQQLLGACQAVSTWPGFFRSLYVTVPSPLQLLRLWAASVRTSLACGYHTARTDFSRIQASGVSSFLMRGDSFERIAFCIDISSSMDTPVSFTAPPGSRSRSGSRMDAVRSEIQQILTSRLSHRQQFSIIVFNGRATEWSHGLAQATPANLAAAVHFLHACTPNGSTSIASALRLALAIPQIQAIYLISDGEDSLVDVREVAAAASAAKKGRRTHGEVSSSIQCHTTAFCAPLVGQKLLRAIAEATGGTFAAFESVPEEDQEDQGDQFN